VTGFAERVVALAADQLPEPERSRRSEEWHADLEGAKEQGLSRFGIAFGALTFAIKAPVTSPVAADRWARWALTFAAIGPVVWLSLRTSGLFMSNPPLRDAILPFVDVTTIVAVALVVVTGLRTRGMPWVASGTVILLCISTLLWMLGAPGNSRFTALIVGSLALAVAGLVTVALRLRAAAGTHRQHIVTLLTLSALPVLVVLWDRAGPAQHWVPLVVALIAILVTTLAVARSPRTARPDDGDTRVASVAVIVVAAMVVGTAVATVIAAMTWVHQGAWPKESSYATAEALTQLVFIGSVSIVLVSGYLLLTAASRRRRAAHRLEGLGFLVAAAIAGSGSVVPFFAPWPVDISLAISTAIAFAGCVLAVGSVVLLMAPRVGDSVEPVAAAARLN
jgi:hypothetical protein